LSTGVLLVLDLVYHVSGNMMYREFVSVMSLVALVTASLVGAIIPFLVLVVQVVARSEYEIVQRSLSWQSMRKVIFYPLTLLVVTVVFGAVLGLGDGEPSTELWRMVVRVTLLVAVPLFAISIVLGIRFIHHSVSILSPRYVFGAAKKALLADVSVSLSEEATFRVGVMIESCG
jgi:hypothetical protein